MKYSSAQQFVELIKSCIESGFSKVRHFLTSVLRFTVIFIHRENKRINDKYFCYSTIYLPILALP